MIAPSFFRLGGRLSGRPFLLALLVICGSLARAHVQASVHTTQVTLLHFSDYHSHALPFYSEGREGQGESRGRSDICGARNTAAHSSFPAAT